MESKIRRDFIMRPIVMTNSRIKMGLRDLKRTEVYLICVLITISSISINY